MRRIALIAVLAWAGALTACGGDAAAPAAAPGTHGNPSVGRPTPKQPDGRTNEAVSAEVARAAMERANGEPCRLVSSRQARAILGERVEAVETAQAPGCVYRGKESFVTVSVGPLDFRRVKPKLGVLRRVKVAGQTAYCGNYGQQMLYVPLARGQVLSVAAPCAQATRFAAAAVGRLES